VGKIGRRTLLQAAVGAPAAIAAASTLGVGTAAAAPAPELRRPQPGPRFTLAVVPDTQYLFDQGGSDPQPLYTTFRDVVRRHRKGDVAFMAHLGDVSEHGTDVELAMVDKAFRIVDGAVSYSVLAGNHDVPGNTDDTRGPTPYSRTFTPARFRRDPTYRGSSADGYNSYHVFDGGGRQWLVLAMDWRISDAGFAWAQQVIDTHRTLPVILTVHDLVAPVGTGGAQLSEHGQRVWEKLIRRNDQIFLALCGHYWPPGRVVLKNDAGHDVHLHITNYQDRYYGGAAMMRLCAFDLVRNAIDIETFSPASTAASSPTMAPCCAPLRPRRSTPRSSTPATPSRRSSSCPIRSSARTRSWGSSTGRAAPARPARPAVTRPTSRRAA